MNNKKPLNITLMGASLDTGNMGVSALAASTIKLILDRKPRARIQLFIGNKYSKPQSLMVNGKKTLVQVLNYRLSPKAPLEKQLLWILILVILHKLIFLHIIRKLLVNTNSILKSLMDSDIILDIRGGDSFSDIYGFRRFLIGSIPDIIILLLGKKLIYLPQTYGPYNKKTTKIFAKILLKKASAIFSRDRQSSKYLNDVYPNLNLNVKFCPDVAFTLEANELKVFESIKKAENNSSKYIGVNINGLMYNGGYTGKNMFDLNFDYSEFIQKLVKTLYDKSKENILLIPHTFGPSGNVNSDPDACMDIYKKMSSKLGSRLNVITKEYDQHDIKSIIGKCDFFIGSRMHSCIAALSQGIPTIGVAYSKKFFGVFDSVGFNEFVVDARKIDQDRAIEKIIKSFNDKDLVVPKLRKNLIDIKNQISLTFDSLLH